MQGKAKGDGEKLVGFTKQAISIRLDRAVVEFFRRQGRGWQTKINEVLKKFMEDES